MHQELTQSRRAEWQKWLRYDTTVPVGGKEVQDFLDEGHKPIDMPWIETDKNQHLKGTPEYTTELKSRLVACGQLDDCVGMRTDSPTCDVEGLNFILTVAASMGWKIKSADVRNAYFQGEPQDRLVLLKPPKGGLPGEEGSEDQVMAARV